MYRFVQIHGKKIMAVFSVFLMIAFAYTGKYGAGSSTRNPIIGTIDGNTKLHSSELAQAKHSWDMLMNLPWRNNQRQADRLGPQISAQINQHPIMFLLLQKEAQRMGVAVSNDLLQTELVNMPGYESADEDRRANAARAISDLLLVVQGFQRGASAIKVSEPMVKRELAASAQTISLNAVDFSAGKYRDKVPPPTAEQLKKQFETYGDVIKGGTSANNPFGFGYKYPDRLKLQYIALPRSDVRKAVESAKTPYDWRVEAQKIYFQNPGRFPTTNKDAAKDGLSLGSGGVKQTPTTRPFAEVENDIKNQLIDAETNKRMDAIRERINTALATDWVTYHNAVPTTTSSVAPTSAPAPLSSLHVPYDSFEYLQKLAASIQNDFGVLPTVVSLADKWLRGEDLSKLAGIGGANALLDVGEVPFGLYLMARTAAFLPANRREETGVLQVLEPARLVRDSAGTTYFVRVSAADPTRKPATLSEVENAVHDDVITAAAYAQAKAEANKLLDQAREKGLSAAAGGKGVIRIGSLNHRPGESVPALSLPAGAAANTFLDGAFDLLATPTSRPSGKPVALIEIPREGRAIVAELDNVDATWTAKSLPFEEAQVQAGLTGQFQSDFARTWFSYPSLSSRLNFVPDTSFKDSEAPPPSPQPSAPIF
jgi:hypothetical protein